MAFTEDEREEIAQILQTIAVEGLPYPRDLPVRGGWQLDHGEQPFDHATFWQCRLGDAYAGVMKATKTARKKAWLED